MTTPPTGDNPNGDWPSHEAGPPTGPPAPPPGYPYGAYPPPSSPPPPAQPAPRRISVGMVFVGPLIYAALNLAIGFLAFIFAGSTTSGVSNAVFATTAVVLALIAFGGGTVLLLLRSPHAKGIGLGLMIGWALTSVVTVGFCTGINPGLYTL